MLRRSIPNAYRAGGMLRKHAAHSVRSVLPVGIEPTSQPPQGRILSIERRELPNNSGLQCTTFRFRFHISVGNLLDTEKFQYLMRYGLSHRHFFDALLKVCAYGARVGMLEGDYQIGRHELYRIYK